MDRQKLFLAVHNTPCVVEQVCVCVGGGGGGGVDSFCSLSQTAPLTHWSNSYEAMCLSSFLSDTCTLMEVEVGHGPDTLRF